MRLSLLALLAVGACHKQLPEDLRDKDTDDTDTYTGPATPEIDIASLAISFGDVGKDCPAIEQTTITNVGTYPLDVDELEIVNDDAGVFTLVTTELEVIAPNEGLAVEVRFTPDDYASFTADLRIHSDDADEWEVFVALDGAVADDPVNTEIFQQALVDPLDVVLVLDRGADDWLDTFTNEVGALAGAFAGLGLDFQLAVLNMDMVSAPGVFIGPVPIITATTPDAGQQLTDNINASDPGSDQRSFDSVNEAFSVVNPGFVRANATLSVVAYSDDDDRSTMAIADFASWLEALKADPADVAYHGVVGAPIFPCFSGLKAADPAPDHNDAITQTGGQHLKICDYSAGDVVSELLNVISGVQSAFPLEYAATDTTQIVVEVDGVVVAEDPVGGWTYAVNSQSIIFHGFATPPPGSEITVTYPHATPC